MAIGSNDPSYTASKIYPYLLARKPFLAVYHKLSPVINLFQKFRGAVCVEIDDTQDEIVLADKIACVWLDRDQFKSVVPLDETAFEPYTDEGSAVTLCSFWEDCLQDAAN